MHVVKIAACRSCNATMVKQCNVACNVVYCNVMWCEVLAVAARADPAAMCKAPPPASLSIFALYVGHLAVTWRLNGDYTVHYRRSTSIPGTQEAPSSPQPHSVGRVTRPARSVGARARM